MISLGLMLLAGKLFPPPPNPKQPAAAAPANAKAGAKGAAPAGEAKKSEQPPPVQAPPPPAAAKAGELPAIARSSVPLQFVALGSLDPNSDYRMLVTLTNAGAAVLRVEMASPRYRDQHDWSGYLGDLELKNVPGGAQVQVVGVGTPAAKAKIEPGDVIVGLGNPQTTSVKTADDLATALADTKPQHEITLQVRHGDQAPQPRVVRLMRRPFAVVRPEIENYRMRKVDPPADFVDRPSFLLTLSELNGKPLSKADAKRIADVLESGTWELTAHDEKSAAFRRALPELNLELVKRYTLAVVPPKQRDDIDFPAYHLRLDVELRGTAAAAPADAKPPSAAYRLDGPTGMPLEGWWYARKVSQHWGGASLRDVAVRFAGSSELEIDNSQIAKGKVPPMGDGQALAYAGVDSQYFSAVLIPQIASLNDVWFDTTEAVFVGSQPDPHAVIYANVTCRLSHKSFGLAADAPHQDSYQVFLGPKRPDLLSQYYPAGNANYSLKDLIYFGWFGAIARVMLVILHAFYSIVGNYGIAILMLTVLVRGAMFPISYKQTKNMARIQALKPEMDRINEKYKNDMQKKSQATQELYRKNKINPLGGCLPLFLQMPVFIGLYRALLVDVELRQSPFFGHSIQWCSNLAAPDMFLNWSAVMPEVVTQGQGLFGLGPYLNVLPLITVVLFLVTQRMTMPAPTNDQAAMQQKMMKYMTLFMGLFFYKVPSGLCLYFIASSMWGIAERKLLPKAPTAGAMASGGASGSVPGSGDKRPRGDASNGSAGPKKSRKAKRKK